MCEGMFEQHPIAPVLGEAADTRKPAAEGASSAGGGEYLFLNQAIACSVGKAISFKSLGVKSAYLALFGKL